MAGKKLLVADDSLTIQKVIRLALSNEGYEIQAVSDGNDAIQQILLFQPDVVLVDVSLPGKTAFELKREANDHPDLQDVRFVLMSSAFEKVDEDQVTEVEFHGRLTKPFDPAHLRDVLTKVFSQIESQQQALKSERTAPISRPNFLSSAPTKEPKISATVFSAADDHMLAEPAFTPPTSVDDPVVQTSPDSDIRQLTESTIRMSGLDDFEWSVQEPSLKPPPAMLTPDTSNFSLENPTPAAAAYHAAPEEPAELPPPIAPAPPPMRAATTPLRPAAPPANQDIEAMVRNEIQKMLPELAEKLLKEEIRRMLSERP
ncbi:MAG: response regulator [Oligoflexia bacterium]|nr:response regulator [Oligoflexia bacterium]